MVYFSTMISISAKELLQVAADASRHSYSPYSKVKVGAALLTSSGKIYTGCNIESGSFGLTCCAERVAIYKAVSEGERRFLKLAITTSRETLITPCGSCRQVLAEWGEELEVIAGNCHGHIESTTLEKLFPKPFRF